MKGPHTQFSNYVHSIEVQELAHVDRRLIVIRRFDACVEDLEQIMDALTYSSSLIIEFKEYT
jgi:hypothetical protein